MRTISTQTDNWLYDSLKLSEILTDHGCKRPKRLELTAAAISNELLAWGSIKWRNLESGFRPRSILLSPNTVTISLKTIYNGWISSGKPNSRMKDATDVNNRPLVYNRLLSPKVIKLCILFDMTLISIIGHGIIERDLAGYIIDVRILYDGNQLLKWGNPGKSLNKGPLSQYISNCKLLTIGYNTLSRWTSSHQVNDKMIKIKDGGKIAEKANANSNRLDTRKGVIKTDIRPLNSVCLNKVLLTNCVKRYYSTDSQDRNKLLLSKLTSLDFLNIEERVYDKQVVLVKLARLKGINSKVVSYLQLWMARSWDFRVHALKTLSKKRG